MTDNPKFLEKSGIENMSNLCANVIGQYIFGALAHESHEDLQRWFKQQRKYYNQIMKKCVEYTQREVPGIIISNPAATIYTVLDVRNIVKPGFDAINFVNYCAGRGRVSMNDGDFTLLVAPISGFYNNHSPENNPDRTQMCIAYAAPPNEMKKVPYLFKTLLKSYEAQRQ